MTEVDIIVTVISILVIAFVVVDIILRISRSKEINIAHTDFKYPQGKDCRMLVDGKTLKNLNVEGKYVIILNTNELLPVYKIGDYVIVDRSKPEKLKKGDCILTNKLMLIKISTVHRDGNLTGIREGQKIKLSPSDISGVIKSKLIY